MASTAGVGKPGAAGLVPVSCDQLKLPLIAAGFNLIAGQFPLEGAVERALGLPAVQNNLIYQWVSGVQNYVLYTRRAAAWTPSEPIVIVGEGFFFQAQAAASWTKTYTVPRP